MPNKVNLNLPASIWTAKDTKMLASNTLASIKLRTSRGIDANGKKFDDYSTKPIYVSFRGARLKPKGGTRKSRTGKSVFYQGGYQQYKHDSRKRNKRAKSAEVDLVLSGQLMNNLVVLSATESKFTIGLTKHVQHYGYAVNADREYLGLTNNEIDIIVEAVSIDISEKLRKKRKR
jgi:hypothetical protein